MKRKEIEEKFLDFVEGALSEELAREISEEMEKDGELRRSFESYKKVMEAERAVASESYSLHANFSAKVLDQIAAKREGGFRDLAGKIYEWYRWGKRGIFTSVASLATVVMVVTLVRGTSLDEISVQRSIEWYSTSKASGPVVAEEIGKEHGSQLVSNAKTVSGKITAVHNNSSLQPSSLGTVTLLVPDGPVKPQTRLSDIKLREVYWPRNDVPPEAIRDRSELKDKYAKVLLQPHVPITAGMVTNDPIDGALPVRPGNRAVTINVDEADVLEGFAPAGSKVDIVITYSDYRTQDVITKVIAQNARVLSLGGDNQGVNARVGRGARVQSARTITLDVAPADALKIRTAEKMGSLSLLMRANDDVKDSGREEMNRGDIEDGKKKVAENRACSKGTIRMDDGLQYELGCDGSIRQWKDLIEERANSLANREGAAIQASSLSDSFAGKQVPKRDTFNSFGPMNGLTYTMTAPLHSNQMTELLTSRVGGLETNRKLNEPGIRGIYDTRRLAPRYLDDRNNSNEQYIQYEENPRILVSTEAKSTFSIDVDTASYSNARRFLNQSQLPPADAVRVEEFINYFDYDYPVKHDKPFTVSYEVAPSPLDPGRHLLKLGIKARETTESGQAWNLVFLIDTSGSMGDANKLELIKRALHFLVDRMRAQDRIAIVTYSTEAKVALESSTAGWGEKVHLHKVIDELRAGGSTNGSAGIQLAYDIASRYGYIKAGGVNRVVLATDGDFNVGITSLPSLLQLIAQKRSTGVTLTTLGVGTGNLKDGTMEQLADKGNGNYYYLDSFEEAKKVFSDGLFAAMEVVAKDVKLEVEFNPQHVHEYRLIGYDNRIMQKQEFSNDTVDAGEVGAGHTVTALYEVVLTDSALARDGGEYRYQPTPAVTKAPFNPEYEEELAFLRMRYKEPEAEASQLSEFPIKRADVRGTSEDTSADFRFAAAVAYFAQILRESRFLSGYSLNEVLRLAEEAKGRDLNGKRSEFIGLVRSALNKAPHVEEYRYQR